MRFQVIGIRFHEFQTVQQVGNVVLAKCNCCKQSRYAVFKVSEKNRFFYYHGYDYEYAFKTFNSLIRFQQIQ
jgi:hypothetical protein